MIGIDDFCNLLQNKINSISQSCSEIDLADLHGALDTVNELNVSVNCFDLLPPAVSNSGRMIFLNDEKFYYYSDGETWLKMDEPPIPENPLTPTRKLWSWGWNALGQLGDGTVVARSSPGTTLASGTDWCAIAAGYCHSLAIKTDGTLWTWGDNTYGQLGNGTSIDRSSPGTIISGGTDWCAIVGGFYHSLAIKTDGSLWSWGRNNEGQLGDGTIICRSSPGTTAAGGTDWCAVASESYHTVAIKTDGTLWTWGANPYGQLGDGTVTDRSSPVTTVAGGTDWCAIDGGNNHSIGLKTDGTIWTWGNNPYGQLGDGTTTSRRSPGTTAAGGVDWCAITAGMHHSIAIKTDGTLWTWGYNVYGQLGDGTITGRNSPVTTAAGGTDWSAVYAVFCRSFAIKTDGTLWTWGRNDYGQLGDGTTTDRNSPVTTATGGTDWCAIAGGKYHSLAITLDT